MPHIPILFFFNREVQLYKIPINLMDMRISRILLLLTTKTFFVDLCCPVRHKHVVKIYKE